MEFVGRIKNSKPTFTASVFVAVISLVGVLTVSVGTSSAATGSTGQYVKVPFSSRVYKVINSSCSTYVSAAAYAKAGKPTIHTVGRIPGDLITNYQTNSGELFYSFPERQYCNGTTSSVPDKIHMTLSQWNSIKASQPTINKQPQGFEKLSNGDIYLVNGCYMAYESYANWSSNGKPTPIKVASLKCLSN